MGRTKDMIRLGFHGHLVRHHTNDTCGDCVMQLEEWSPKTRNKRYTSHEILDKSVLHYNHYKWQSWEQFESKIDKGYASLKGPVHRNTKLNFLKADMEANAIWDSELARKQCMRKADPGALD